MSQLVAKVDKEQITSIFRVLTVKQDTDTQVFTSDFLIGMKDIATLARSMDEQLRPYSQLSYTDSATVEFSNNRTKDFQSISDLATANWDKPSTTASVTLRWNLLLEMKDTEKPVEHNIVLRISSGIRPQDMMRAIFSKDLEEVDSFDLSSAGCVCHITFATQSLANDIFRVVQEWTDGRSKPEYTIPYLVKIRQNSKRIARFTEFSMPVTTAATILAYYFYSTRDQVLSDPVTTDFVRTGVLYVSMTWLVYTFSRAGSKWLSNRLKSQLDRIGRIHPFMLTAGDDNRQNSLSAKNKKNLRGFFFEAAFAVTWNVVAGFIIYYLTK